MRKVLRVYVVRISWSVGPVRSEEYTHPLYLLPTRCRRSGPARGIVYMLTSLPSLTLENAGNMKYWAELMETWDELACVKEKELIELRQQKDQHAAQTIKGECVLRLTKSKSECQKKLHSIAS